MADEQKIDTGYDMAGITSAVLCTIHCLVIPALFVFKFSVADNNVTSPLPSWWNAIDYLFLIISFVAVYHSASHTPAKSIRIGLWCSWALLAIAIIFEAQLHWLAYIASAGLITGHFLNIMRMRRMAKAQKIPL